MQMYPFLASHIVLRTRVREEIHLYIVVDAFLYEAQAVLPYHHRIDDSLTYQELAF